MSSECRRLVTRILAYFMENKVVRWTGRCGPMCATATSVVDSRVTLTGGDTVTPTMIIAGEGKTRCALRRF
jgi:hypothetical protein